MRSFYGNIEDRTVSWKENKAVSGKEDTRFESVLGRFILSFRLWWTWTGSEKRRVVGFNFRSGPDIYKVMTSEERLEVEKGYVIAMVKEMEGDKIF